MKDSEVIRSDGSFKFEKDITVKRNILKNVAKFIAESAPAFFCDAPKSRHRHLQRINHGVGTIRGPIQLDMDWNPFMLIQSFIYPFFICYAPAIASHDTCVHLAFGRNTPVSDHVPSKRQIWSSYLMKWLIVN